MKKSTKKYLLYGVGAYVLLTSGVIGATKVRERSNRLEALGDDLDDWKREAQRLERDYNEIVATLNSDRATYSAEVEALKAKLAQVQGWYEDAQKRESAVGQAYMKAEEFIVKKDLSLNMWNQYLSTHGNAARSNPLSVNWAIDGRAWSDPPELPPHSATASN